MRKAACSYYKHAYYKLVFSTSRTMPPRTIQREIAFSIIDVARLLKTYADQRARQYGMTRAQWAVLFRLDRSEGPQAIGVGRNPRPAADLAHPPARPARRKRPDRAPPRSERSARQPVVSDAGGAARCSNGSTTLGEDMMAKRARRTRRQDRTSACSANSARCARTCAAPSTAINRNSKKSPPVKSS